MAMDTNSPVVLRALEDALYPTTLSGGAGYAELTGRHLTEILADVLKLLEHCPAKCDRSCEGCLRHYSQGSPGPLHRRPVSLQVPPELPAAIQAAGLEGLARLLQLDGFKCTPVATVQGKTVPLVVERGTQRVVIGTQSGLLESPWAGHSLTSMLSDGRAQGRVLNDYSSTQPSRRASVALFTVSVLASDLASACPFTVLKGRLPSTMRRRC